MPCVALPISPLAGLYSLELMFYTLGTSGHAPCRRSIAYFRRNGWFGGLTVMALSTLKKRIEKKQSMRGPDECWPWLGYINEDGEARIWVDDELGSISVARAIFLARDGE